MADAPNDIPIRFEILAHEALVNVLWTGTMLKRAARTFFKGGPIKEAEFNLLLVLRHSDIPLSQNELSARLLVDKSNVTSLIDRLQKADLIRRNPVPEDRRRYHITLTADGRRLIDTIDPIYHRLVEDVMSGLSDAEHRSLVRLTRKLRQGLRSVDPTFPAGG